MKPSPVFRHSLRHAEGSSCGVLAANQDGCPLGEGSAKVVGPRPGRTECRPAVSRVRAAAREAAWVFTERPAGKERGPRQAARGPGESLGAGMAGSKPLTFNQQLDFGQSEGVVTAPCPRVFYLGVKSVVLLKSSGLGFSVLGVQEPALVVGTGRGGDFPGQFGGGSPTFWEKHQNCCGSGLASSLRAGHQSVG